MTKPRNINCIEIIYDLIKERDRDAFEIVRLTGMLRSNVRFHIAELLNQDRIFKYRLHPEKHNSRMAYTVDPSKAMEETEEKPKGILPGARVYRIEDRSRAETLKAIMRSQSTKKRATAYPGTSWVHMEMAL
jgi:predicted transcriptional regulator